jgi:fatty-acyl-CoA synthase
VNLAQSLARAAASTSGVLICGEKFAYSTLAQRAERAARLLIAKGIRPGDRIGVILPTSAQFYDAFFGCILAGAIPAPMYPPLRLGRLEEYHKKTAAMLRTIDAKLVITDTRVIKLLGETLAQAKPVLGWVTTLDEDADATLPTIADDDVAFIQFSSGTTSMPKPIPLTHRQIIANIDSFVGVVRGQFPDVTHYAVSWLPLYHDMGLIGALLGAVHFPGPLTLLAPEAFVGDPATWLRAISESRGTVSAAPNFAYSLCVDRVRDEDIKGIDLSCWKMALNGAEPVSPRVIERFIERFAPYGFAAEAMMPVYGLAEATLAVTFGRVVNGRVATSFDAQALARDGAVSSSKADDVIRLVSLGRALPCAEVQVADAGGAPVADEHLGRVLIRGPSITDGYLGDPPRPRDAWMDTGDTGFIYQGELYLYGRTKDMVVVRGRKYAPHDIEHALADLPGMRAGCVVAVGLPGDDGEELAVFVERGRDGIIDEQELQRRVTAACGLNVARVVVLGPGTLPRTSSGKLSRSETRRRFLAGELRPPKKMGVVQILWAIVRSRFALRSANGSTRAGGVT